jgi:hypothetical protein
MTIEAIETEYKGYKFRSRLEAKWAVFFDAMDWVWEYEPEGYKMEYKGEIIRYLPDFRLPDKGAYVEVKGPALNAADRLKIEALTHETNAPVYLLSDIPEEGVLKPWDICICPDENHDLDGFVLWMEYEPYENDMVAEYVAALKKARQARFEHGEKG